ncbi:MAG TPA: hypothetical protein DEF45_19575 [Rhodopirellula sp.]|nr:MAG: hypothetical protein CBD74_08355 [Saprospirales bacterium TMED214]HBV65214.1 hypothetical protein [Rhodopirellula sp.]
MLIRVANTAEAVSSFKSGWVTNVARRISSQLTCLECGLRFGFPIRNDQNQYRDRWMLACQYLPSNLFLTGCPTNALLPRLCFGYIP